MSKPQKAEFSLETILSNPVDSKTLKGFIDESILCKTKVRTENEALADIRNEAKEKLCIPPSLFNNLVKTKFNESLEADQAKLEATDATLTKLYGTAIHNDSDDSDE
jgi:hypothetical protein